MEESATSTSLPGPVEPISRPSSTSTSTDAAIAQLPGITAIAASAASVANSPQMRADNIPVPEQTTHTPVPAPSPSPAPPVPASVMNPGQSPAAHAPTPSGSLPTCQNCSTSTTPLWRRDEHGAVLCNACGLFLKLHGRNRPISLKTDVIKSRNRVKTMRPDMQMKKKQSLPAANPNGHGFQAHDATAAALAAVRATQQKTNGHGLDSPMSRDSPNNVYDPNLSADFQAMTHFQPDGLTHYAMAGDRPATPSNGEHGLEAPQTHEQLIAANSSLKTRVSELEVINELYRGRLQQLEQDNQTADNFRHAAEMSAKEAATERAQREEIGRQLEDSHRRENNLKRRCDEQEQEIEDLKAKLADGDFERAAKRPKFEHQPDPEPLPMQISGPEPETEQVHEPEQAQAQEQHPEHAQTLEQEPEQTQEPIPESEIIPEPLAELVKAEQSLPEPVS